MDIAITGSTGLIGTALKTKLQELDHNPIEMVRSDKHNSKSNYPQILWQPAKGIIDKNAFEDVEAVINLAGANIGGKRWSDEYKKILYDSRIDTTKLLAETLASAKKKPEVFISGSAIGCYGNRSDETLDEQSTLSTDDDDFLAKLTIDWELSAQPAADAGIRTCLARTGIVLSKEGGALKKMLPAFKMGLGGKFGSGDQVMSWISIDDVVGSIIHLLENDIAGPVNLTAPEPVENKIFVKTLGKAIGRPSLLPVPEFAPKLLLGSELAQALLFDGAKIMPKVLLDSGYEFKHNNLEKALADLL